MAVYLNSNKKTKPLLSTYQHNAYYNSELIWRNTPFAADYFKIDGSYSITPQYTNDPTNELEYSINNGSSWNPAPSGVEFLTDGKQVLMRGSGRDSLYTEQTPVTNRWAIQSSPGEAIEVSGDICTLLDYQNPPTALGSFAFAGMFSPFRNLRHARNLYFSATEAGAASLRYMFNNCSALETAPQLGFTTYGANAAQSMFSGCTSLTVTPAISGLVSVATNGFHNMFYNCNSLLDASNITINTMDGNGCCTSMFEQCTSLVVPPNITAMTIPAAGCSRMFYYCSSLVNPPELPATTIGQSSYYQMFMQCHSLVSMSDISHLTGVQPTYATAEMFSQCSSLTIVYPLNFVTIGNNGAREMFRGCSALITPPAVRANDWGSNGCAGLFWDCTSLTSLPVINALQMVGSTCNQMFQGCTSLGVYIASGAGHDVPYRIPASGTPTGSPALLNMFSGIKAGSTVPVTPSVGVTYYAENALVS